MLDTGAPPVTWSSYNTDFFNALFFHKFLNQSSFNSVTEMRALMKHSTSHGKAQVQTKDKHTLFIVYTRYVL